MINQNSELSKQESRKASSAVSIMEAEYSKYLESKAWLVHFLEDIKKTNILEK